MHKLKIRAVGNSLGVVLPKEVLARHGLQKDDELMVVETTNGLELRLYDPKVGEQIDRGRDIARRYSSALRELAK